MDSNGTLVPGTYTEWSATVSSATTFAIVATPVLGSDQVYPAGSTTQVFLPVSSSAHNKLVDGILEFADQSGNLLNQAVKDALGVTTDPAGGWDLLNSGTGPSAVTNNGNHSYDLTFASVDLTSVLSKGMRLRLTRTVTAPTQCADLESGSSQYFSKTSPSGISFTTTFTCSAWIKPESYTAGGIIARRNADTEGWSLKINSSGQVSLMGLRIASNNKEINSYQSIPLNKWTHVAATIDMAAGDTSAQKIWINGVEVPRLYTLTGTASALVQGTTALVVGAEKSAGTNPFDGKIAQAAVFSTQLSDATVKAMIGQTLTGSESGVVSAFTLNNSLLDLTANDNDLTAQGSALATNTDSPFAGGNVQEYTDGTTEMAVVMADPVFSTNTTVTVQVPEGYALPTSGGISAVYYSTQKVPYGFPGQRGKWNVSTVVSAQLNNVITTTAWANLGSLNLKIPIGSWRFGHEMVIQSNPASAGIVDFTLTLGTTAAAAGDAELTSQSQSNTAAVTMAAFGATITRNRFIDLAAETTYYLNARNNTVANQTIYIRGDTGQCIIYAENAYL